MRVATLNGSHVDIVRLREMLARGHLLGDLGATREIAREFRIAAEETLAVTGIEIYLRSPESDLLTRCCDEGETTALPELVRRAERDRRPACESEGSIAPGDAIARRAWPLLIGDRLIGVVACEAGGESAELLEILSGVAAHAFERAMILESRGIERRDSQLRASCLGYIQDHLRLVLGSGDIEEYLNLAVESARDALGFRIVLLRVYDHEREAYVARASTGLPAEAREACFQRQVTREEIAPLFSPAFRVNRSYFVTHEAPLWKGREERTYVPDLGPRGQGEWNARDCLLVPVEDGRGNRLGYLSVDDPADRRPPSHETVAILEIFADLIALGLEREMLRKNLLG